MNNVLRGDLLSAVSLITNDTLMSGSISTNSLSGKIDRDFINGLSAFEIAVKHGYTGTEEEWIESIGGTTDYSKLTNVPTINGVAIQGDYVLGGHLGILDKTISVSDIALDIKIATTAQWDSEPTYIPERGRIIIYSDYKTVEGVSYMGMKIGDGTTYLIDLPFFNNDIHTLLEKHMNDTVSHITEQEREFWNNKSRVSEVQGETLLITSL